MSDLTVLLATVELQLLLQCLRTPDLLQFARCNRRLLSAAEHPFSWKFTCLPIDVVMWNGFGVIPPGSNLPARIDARLPMSVRWLCSLVRVTAVDIANAMEFCESVHMRELHLANAMQLTPEQLVEILSSPIVTTHTQRLSIADAANYWERNIMPTIVRCLPQLTALQIGAGTTDDWASFAMLPALTTLGITIFKNPVMDETHQLGFCRSLRDLTLTFSAAANSLGSFSGLPQGSLPLVERFTLVCWRGTESFDAPGLFKAMPAMHTITLRRCMSMDSLLRNLARVRSRSLLRLIVQLHSNPTVNSAVSRFAPTPPIVVFVMCTMGQLRVDLEVSSAPKTLDEKVVCEYLEKLRLCWLADAAMQSLGDRLRIL